MKYLKRLSKLSGFMLLILTLSAGALSMGFILQYMGFGGVKYKPCPLCILQRLCFLVCLLIAASALLYPAWRRLWAAIIGIATLLGAGLAGYQLWLQGRPSASCGIDPIENFIERYLLNDYIAWFLRVEAMCTDKQPLFWGLQIPQWSIGVYFVMFIMLWLAQFRRR